MFLERGDCEGYVVGRMFEGGLFERHYGLWGVVFDKGSGQWRV